MQGAPFPPLITDGSCVNGFTPFWAGSHRNKGAERERAAQISTSLPKQMSKLSLSMSMAPSILWSQVIPAGLLPCHMATLQCQTQQGWFQPEPRLTQPVLRLPSVMRHSVWRQMWQGPVPGGERSGPWNLLPRALAGVCSLQQRSRAQPWMCAQA